LATEACVPTFIYSFSKGLTPISVVDVPVCPRMQNALSRFFFSIFLVLTRSSANSAVLLKIAGTSSFKRAYSDFISSGTSSELRTESISDKI